MYIHLIMFKLNDLNWNIMAMFIAVIILIGILIFISLVLVKKLWMYKDVMLHDINL